MERRGRRRTLGAGSPGNVSLRLDPQRRPRDLVAEGVAARRRGDHGCQRGPGRAQSFTALRRHRLRRRRAEAARDAEGLPATRRRAATVGSGQARHAKPQTRRPGSNGDGGGVGAGAGVTVRSQSTVRVTSNRSGSKASEGAPKFAVHVTALSDPLRARSIGQICPRPATTPTSSVRARTIPTPPTASASADTRRGRLPRSPRPASVGSAARSSGSSPSRGQISNFDSSRSFGQPRSLEIRDLTPTGESRSDPSWKFESRPLGAERTNRIGMLWGPAPARRTTVTRPVRRPLPVQRATGVAPAAGSMPATVPGPSPRNVTTAPSGQSGPGRRSTVSRTSPPACVLSDRGRSERHRLRSKTRGGPCAKMTRLSWLRPKHQGP